MQVTNPIHEMKYDRFHTIGHCHWIVFRVSLGELQGDGPWPAGEYEYWAPVTADSVPMWKKVS